MEKTIREIIIDNIKKENICSEEELNKRIKQLEQQPIEESKLLNKHFNKSLKEKNIKTTEDFFNLTPSEANKIFKKSILLTRNYIKSLSTKITKALLKHNKNTLIKAKAQNQHPKLIELINKIKQSPKLSECLKEDMIQRERINNVDPLEQLTTRKFINTRLDLNSDELALLRRYLLEEIELKDLEKSKNKIKYYNQLTTIYEELIHYIKKLKYKEILKLNYNDLKELGLTKSDINALKRNHITKIEDIIEYSEKEMLKLPMIGNIITIKIIKGLQEKNIILLNDKEKLKDILKYENANILTIKEKKNQK